MAKQITIPECALSIIVVNWNTGPLLAECLRSIYAHTSSLDFEIIVVDNGSTDGSPDMAADFPEVILIRNRRNVGFSRANNQGFSVARGKYIGLLNPDAVLLNEAFEILVSVLESDPSLGIVGPQLLGADGVVERTCARGFITLRSEFMAATGLAKFSDHFGSGLYYSEYNISRVVDCVSGACLVIRREALKGSHIFDPEFFMYGEDVDLCYGVKAHGWKVFYCADARVLHYGKVSSSQNPMTSLHGVRSNHLFISKNYGRIAGLLDRGIWLFASGCKYPITFLALWIVPEAQQKWVRRRHLYSQLMRWALGIPTTLDAQADEMISIAECVRGTDGEA